MAFTEPQTKQSLASGDPTLAAAPQLGAAPASQFGGEPFEASPNDVAPDNAGPDNAPGDAYGDPNADAYGEPSVLQEDWLDRLSRYGQGSGMEGARVPTMGPAVPVRSTAATGYLRRSHPKLTVTISGR